MAPRIGVIHPPLSLWVILPCDAWGKKICISSMTNLAVCFHGDGAHIIYSSPHFPLSFLSAHPFLFPLRPSHRIAFDSLSMRYSTVIRDIEPFRGKIHFASDLAFPPRRVCNELGTARGENRLKRLQRDKFGTRTLFNGFGGSR